MVTERESTTLNEMGARALEPISAERLCESAINPTGYAWSPQP